MMKLEQIAKLAGVSRTTASYVINGKAQQYRISEKTQQKVMAVVNQHNYTPNYAASSLRAGNSRTFGLIIPDLENASYAKLAKLLERDARKLGYQLIISCSDDDIETEIQVAENLLSRRIDVLLVASSLPAEHPFYRQALNKGIPIVALDRAMDDEVFASVISEDLEGALSLCQTLLTPHTRSIGLIGAVPELVVSKERQQGFDSAIKQCPQKIKVQYSYGDHFSIEQGKLLMQTWIDQQQIPDAILVTSYTLFEGVLDCVSAYPEILANTRFATFGDHRLLDFLPMKIQSLPLQLEIIAEKALCLAMQASKSDYQVGIEIVPRRLITRG
ncbi:catabolite repressor/activator [Motilimonas sp. E26]|uniref:catabolite repressor/activator n=1 Tax=Motilimonas sp. E26 TaxID=2865674 RepID=UPI001E4C73A5|nr:catabolite repressor/activator [Motilimonas sp. E26]